MSIVTPRVLFEEGPVDLLTAEIAESFVHQEYLITDPDTGDQYTMSGVTGLGSFAAMAGDGITVVTVVGAVFYDASLGQSFSKYYLLVFNRKTKAVITTQYIGTSGFFYDLVISKDGSTIVLKTSTTYSIFYGALWANRIDKTVPVPTPVSASNTHYISISRDGSTIFIADLDYQPHGRVLVWDGTNWGTETVIAFPDAGIFTGTHPHFGAFVSCSDDGSKVAIGSPNYQDSGGFTLGAVYVYSGAGWSVYERLRYNGYSGVGYTGALSPDGTKVVASPYQTNTYTRAVAIWTYGGASWTYRTLLWSRCNYEKSMYTAFTFGNSNQYVWATAGPGAQQEGHPHHHSLVRIDLNDLDSMSSWNLTQWQNELIFTAFTFRLWVADDASYVVFTSSCWDVAAAGYEEIYQICGLELNVPVPDVLVPKVLAPNTQNLLNYSHDGAYVSLTNRGSLLYSVAGGEDIRLTFNTGTGINSTTDVITTDQVHNLYDGAYVRYQATDSTSIGLASGTNRYVKVISPTQLSLYTDVALTSKVNLTASGSQTHYLIGVPTRGTVYGGFAYGVLTSSLTLFTVFGAGVIVPGKEEGAMASLISPDGRYLITSSSVAYKSDPTTPNFEVGKIVSQYDYSFSPWNVYDQFELDTSGIVDGDRWGRSLALSDGGQLLAVAGVNPTITSHRGAVQIYTTGKVKIQTITPPESVPAIGEQFGVGLQLKNNGRILFIGAPKRLTTSGGEGKIYIYTSTGYDGVTDPTYGLFETIEDPDGSTDFTEVGNYVDASDDGSVLVFSGKDSVSGEYTIFVRNQSGYVRITEPGVLEFGRVVRVTGDGKQVWTIDRARNIYRYSGLNWSKRKVWPASIWPGTMGTNPIGAHNQSMLDVDYFGMTVALGDPYGNVVGGNIESGRVLLLRNPELFPVPYNVMPPIIYT